MQSNEKENQSKKDTIKIQNASDIPLITRSFSKISISINNEKTMVEIENKLKDRELKCQELIIEQTAAEYIYRILYVIQLCGTLKITTMFGEKEAKDKDALNAMILDFRTFKNISKIVILPFYDENKNHYRQQILLKICNQKSIEIDFHKFKESPEASCNVYIFENYTKKSDQKQSDIEIITYLTESNDIQTSNMHNHWELKVCKAHDIEDAFRKYKENERYNTYNYDTPKIPSRFCIYTLYTIIIVLILLISYIVYNRKNKLDINN